MNHSPLMSNFEDRYSLTAGTFFPLPMIRDQCELSKIVTLQKEVSHIRKFLKQLETVTSL